MTKSTEPKFNGVFCAGEDCRYFFQSTDIDGVVEAGCLVYHQNNLKYNETADKFERCMWCKMLHGGHLAAVEDEDE